MEERGGEKDAPSKTFSAAVMISRKEEEEEPEKEKVHDDDYEEGAYKLYSRISGPSSLVLVSMY